MEQKTEETCVACTDRFQGMDSLNNFGGMTGLLRVSEYRGYLSKILKKNEFEFLTHQEISFITRSSIRDPLGRIEYGTFPELLKKVRFRNLRRKKLENDGTEMQKMLLNTLKKGEEEFFIPNSSRNILYRTCTFVHHGYLYLKDIITVLSRNNIPDCNFESLSSLQLHILLFDSKCDSKNDDKVDYYELVPLLAAAIEYLSREDVQLEKKKLVRTATYHTYREHNILTTRKYTFDQLKALSQFALSVVRVVGDESPILPSQTSENNTSLPAEKSRQTIVGKLRKKSVDKILEKVKLKGRDKSGKRRDSKKGESLRIILRGDDAVVTASRPFSVEEKKV